jgi:hypothetical protein
MFWSCEVECPICKKIINAFLNDYHKHLINDHNFTMEDFEEIHKVSKKYLDDSKVIEIYKQK